MTASLSGAGHLISGRRGEGSTSAGSAGFAAGDCFAATYGLLLGALQRDPRILGDDRCFRYDDDAADVSPLMRLRWTTRTYAEAIHDWYHIEEQTTTHPSLDATWRHLARVTGRGRPVIVCADTSMLPHLRRTDRREHRIVVTEVRDDRAFIVDGTIGVSFCGWMSRKWLGPAITSPNLDSVAYPAGGVTIELDAGDSAATHSEPKTRRAVRALANTHTDALRSLAAGLDRAGSPVPDPGDDAFIYDGTSVFREVSAQRRLNASFLGLAAEVTGDEHWRTPQVRAAQMARAWDALRVVFRYNASRNSTVLYKLIAPRVARLADLEDELTSLIGSLVDVRP